MILVLGGTVEGRRLAEALTRAGIEHVSSLAGRTSSSPELGPVRTGGFGGAAGLASYLREHHVSVVIDATHPFAATMSHHAALACEAAGVRLIRCERPGWSTHPDAEGWTWVDDHEAAAAAVLATGSLRPLLSVGRLHTLDYAPPLHRLSVLARVAEPPSGALPEAWRLLVARGPFQLPDEQRLFAEESIDCLVTKDSGGSATAAKLDAARQAGARVVVVRRPRGPETVETAPSVEECLALLGPA